MSSSTTAKPINSVTKGRRTGVVMASPGKVPLDEEGMEDIDTFWNSEKVQQQEESTSNESSSIEKGGKKRENLEKKEEENEEEPNFDVGVSIQRKIGNKARYTALARRVLERQARQLDRGALSPSAQSVGTEVTELSATSMTGVSVDSPQVEVIGGTPTSTRYVKRTSDATADDMEVLSPGAASLMSPITPGEASTSAISEGNSFLQQKSKKLDTLLENDEEEINRKDDDSKPPSKESVDFGRGDGDHFDYDNDDEDGYGVEDYDDDGGGEDQVVQDEADESNVEVSIVEDEETPQKVRDQRAREERKALKTKQMKAKKKKRKTASGSGSVVSFSSPMSVHLPAGPREYDNVPVSDFNKDDDSDYENTGSRRSKRARFAPLQFWKNEKVVYGPNDNPSTFGNMPVVTTIQQALPTPMKKIHRAKPGKKILVQNLSDDDERPSAKSTKQKKFDKRKLNKQLNYVKGDTVTVWDEGSREFSEQKIVAFASKMELVELPIAKKRSKEESKVSGKAVQAFNVPQATDNIPGWISGNMILPPKGIKDAENVGICSQVFFVGDCQPGSFEVSIANPEDDEFDPLTAHRFMISKGDFFHVPPHNIYRVENHSETDDANLFWCIIRPTS